MDFDGNFVQAFQYGGASDLDTHEVGIDALENIYLAAHFQGTVDINPSEAEELNVTSIGFRDNYLIKFAPNMATPTRSPVAPRVSAIAFPNPIADIIFIKSSQVISNLPYEIYDVKGRKVLFGLISSTNSIRIGQLNTGAYFLRIGTDISLSIIKK